MNRQNIGHRQLSESLATVRYRVGWQYVQSAFGIAMLQPISDQQLEVIRQSAQACIDAVKASMNVSLAYDEESIRAIDKLIQKAWPGRPPAENVAMRIQTWGSFLGEAMCKALGARWVSTEHGPGVAMGHMVAHPFAKVEKRFNTGMLESVSYFYKTFKQRSTPGTPEQDGRMP